MKNIIPSHLSTNLSKIYGDEITLLPLVVRHHNFSDKTVVYIMASFKTKKKIELKQGGHELRDVISQLIQNNTNLRKIISECEQMCNLNDDHRMYVTYMVTRPPKSNDLCAVFYIQFGYTGNDVSYMNPIHLLVRAAKDILRWEVYDHNFGYKIFSLDYVSHELSSTKNIFAPLFTKTSFGFVVSGTNMAEKSKNSFTYKNIKFEFEKNRNKDLVVKIL